MEIGDRVLQNVPVSHELGQLGVAVTRQQLDGVGIGRHDVFMRKRRGEVERELPRKSRFNQKKSKNRLPAICHCPLWAPHCPVTATHRLPRASKYTKVYNRLLMDGYNTQV
jgi:hypothetical protein